MKLSQLLRDERSVTLDVDGESLPITYRPSGITPETEEAFLGGTERNRSGGAMASLLSDVLVSWGLEGEDGEPYPIDEDSLRRLPIPFLGDVLGAIFEDMRPNARKRAPSVGGSLVKE